VALIAVSVMLSCFTAASAENFTIVALPDTQFYSESYPAIFTAQTQWIVDNKDALNIVYVAHEGDIVNVATSTAQWDNADAAMDLLENPATTGLADGIAYGMAPGNHDEPLTNFNSYFGVPRFSGRSYYGGHKGSTNENSYMLFSAGEMNFIVVNIENTPDVPDNGAIAWADGIIQTYSDRRAIVVSHWIIGSGGAWATSGQAIYDGLKDNPNLFLMLCGHVHAEARRSDTYNDNTVHTLLADYQGEPNGGDGWLRIMEFSPDNNEIYVKTYSPTLSSWETDADSEFTLSYEMQPDPPSVEFTAYNDMAWGTGQLETNITKITSPNGGSGLPSTGTLVKYSDGSSTAISLTVTGGSYIGGVQATHGAEPAGGTDAYTYFNGKVSCLGAISYDDTAPPAGNLVLTLTEMDPNKTYNLSYYANRGSYDWDRASLVTISGADVFTNSSSAATDNPTGTGGTIFDAPTDASTRLPADNGTRGYVAYFTDVNSGSDGEVVLTISYDGTGGTHLYKGKYASALMVQQLGFDLPTEPNQSAFRAYIDLNATSGGNHSNVLEIVPTGPDTQPINSATDWVLKNFDTGAALPITMWVDMDVRYPTTNGADSDPGTDAYNLFGGIVNGQDGYELDLADTGDYVTVTFENLDPNAEYVIACTYDRQKLSDPYTDRASQITISGADTYTNASSTGVVVNSPNSVSFTTGDNTTTGYVAKWTNVTAVDGSFSITTVQDNTPPWTGSKGYAVTSFLLEGNVEPPEPNESNDVDFTAYIDLNSQSGDDNHSNVLALIPTAFGTPWTPPLLDPCEGLALIDFDTGQILPVTMSVDLDVRYATTNGDDSDSGTDADLLFGGIVDGVGGYELDGPNFVTVTFDNLDPNKEYIVACTYDRQKLSDPYTDRASRITISGADTYTNASSSGVVANAPNSVSFTTGDNTTTGYVAKWTNVTAADGSFSITTVQDTTHGWIGEKGYAMTSIMLQQTGEMVECAVFGDYYNASAKTQAVANLVDSWNVDFIFTTGDNTGSNPIDTDIGQFYSDYIGSYTGSYGSGSATNRFFPALGNHDNDDGGALPAYLAYFTLPGAGIPSSNTSGNERYYDFIWGPLHVFVINSEATPPIDPDGRTSTSTQGQWLQAQLAASTAPWKLVTFHHPPYSSTSGKSGGDVVMQWPFQQWGATAVFSGHNHGYERIMKNGFPYFVSAAGGRPLYGFDPPVPGSVVRYNNDNGAMRLKATNTSIIFEFWSLNTSDGTNGLIDTYTIGAPPSEGFTAYNDTAWASGQIEGNITKITSPTGGSLLPSSGELIDFATGAGTGITLTVAGGSYDGDSGGQGGHGDSTMAGDALGFFAGKLDPLGTVSYIDLAGSNLVFTFTGMDPNDRYELVHYAHRNGSSSYEWERAAWATLSGADSFTNSSTAGLDNNVNPLFSGPTDPNTKYAANNASGRVVRYTNIDPGSDGEIVLTMSYAGENADGSPGVAAYKGKYSNAVMLRGTILAEEPNEPHELPILLGDKWKYFKGTVEPPADWNDLTFDDSSWFEGPTGIGYGDTDDATVLSDMQNNYISVYARRDFNVPDPNAVYRLLFSMDYDDGFVAYLNGTEIARANVTGNPPAYDAVADGDHEASGGHPDYAEPVEYFEVDKSLLLTGRNVLAFQGHNKSLSSSDFSMLPALEDVNYNWIAYINLNTHNPEDQTDPHALMLDPWDSNYTTSAWVLNDYDTNQPLPVTVSIDMDIRYPTHNGDNCQTGTDADNLFGGIIDLSGGMEIDEPNGHYLTTTFENLDPNKEYTVALTYNRRDTSGYLDRATRFTIIGADTYTQASSSGVVINSPNSVSFCTGYNKENGYVAQWTDVTADDGSFSVTAVQDTNPTYGWTGPKGYTMTAVMLQELSLIHISEPTRPY